MPHANPIVEYYDKLAKDYDHDRFANSYGKFIDRKERSVLSRLLKRNNETVLDLACGSGRLSHFASIGVDGSEQMIRVAQGKYPDKQFHVSDAERIPLEPNSVDAIISFHFFMHLDAEKVNRILQECSRVLKPNGRVIFDIPSKRRRKKVGYTSQGWHGAFSLSLGEVKAIPHFSVKSVHGILFIPIHRFPSFVRPLLAPFDWLLANSFLKEYSSYLIVELQKNNADEEC